MDPLWFITLAGVVLLFATLLDVLLAVLHIDMSGFIGTTLQDWGWSATIGRSRRMPRMRRSLLSLAGPIMIVVTFIAWIGLFLLSFALICWPHLHKFRADEEIEVFTFIHARLPAGAWITQRMKLLPEAKPSTLCGVP
jgi:hypothetical protein